jgi:hypothetical protein
VLPIDLWKAWPNTSLEALLTERSSSKLNLTAADLDLADASLLSGWIFPVAGIVRGNLTVEGPIDNLQFGGQMTLHGGHFELGRRTAVLSDVQAEITGVGNELRIDSLTGRHLLGAFTANGIIGWKTLAQPQFDFRIASDAVTLPIAWVFPSQDGHVVTSLTLNLFGDATSATIRGEGRIDAIAQNHPINLTPLWNPLPTPATSEIARTECPAPWNQWKWDVALRTDGPQPATVRPLGGNVRADLQLQGTLGAPQLGGTFEIVGSRAAVQAVVLDVDKLTLARTKTEPACATIDLVARGELSGESFAVFASGPLNHPLRLVVAPPPLTEDAVWDALEGRERPLPESSGRFSLRSTAPLGADVELFEWREIPTPSSPETGNVTVTGPSSGFDGFF